MYCLHRKQYGAIPVYITITVNHGKPYRSTPVYITVTLYLCKTVFTRPCIYYNDSKDIMENSMDQLYILQLQYTIETVWTHRCKYYSDSILWQFILQLHNTMENLMGRPLYIIMII